MALHDRLWHRLVAVAATGRPHSYAGSHKRPNQGTDQGDTQGRFHRPQAHASSMADDFPAPAQGIVLRQFIVSNDAERRWYSDVFRGVAVRYGESKGPRPRR
jgi:hypothetical protein